MGFVNKINPLDFPKIVSLVYLAYYFEIFSHVANIDGSSPECPDINLTKCCF